MLSMVAVIPLGFVLLIWNSYRGARRRAERGESFAPSGKLRWEERP